MSEKSEFNFMTCLSELNYSLRVFLTVLIARFFFKIVEYYFFLNIILISAIKRDNE